LLYIYYAFENRKPVYRALWKLSDQMRAVVSRLPFGLRYYVSQMLAVTLYWPFARFARILESLGCLPVNWPLAYYRDKPFYVMRTDSLDRFGTRLEQRFTQAEISCMLMDAGFSDIKFSDRAPYWCVVGIKA
jgi:hypothetical protein